MHGRAGWDDGIYTWGNISRERKSDWSRLWGLVWAELERVEASLKDGRKGMISLTWIVVMAVWCILSKMPASWMSSHLRLGNHSSNDWADGEKRKAQAPPL